MNYSRILARLHRICTLALLSFTLPLAAHAASVTRGPYLQMGTPTNIIVRWRTDAANDSRVRFGDSATNLVNAADDSVLTTNHLVTLTNLAPDTVYYYSVGSTTQMLAGGTNFFFRTAPPAGSTRPIRVWVLGDFGYTNQSAIPVRNGYAAFAGARYTDLWLMLGDNAYHGGGDGVWQVSVFNTYSNLLRQTVLWSTIGNQETGGSPTLPPTMPYLQIFTFPTAAECGGFASGSERYYSFNYGNVHFVCLDSMSSARTNGSPMLLWLEADLAANTADWLIAFWHHPPYSKGSNDSDVRTEEIEMRTNAVRLLEAHGVDLVLCGHSHSYERSYLLDGHYGFSTSFVPSMRKDAGDGRVDGTGAYAKATLGPAMHEGAVYAVAGSGAETRGGPLNHPAMYRSLNNLGSMVLDIHANRLDAKFIRETGATDDYFTITKGAAELRVVAIGVTNGAATLTWSSVADRTYRVEHAPSLSPMAWIDLSGPLIAEGARTSWSATAGAGFYRVRGTTD